MVALSDPTSSLQQTVNPSDPGLADVLAQLKKEIMLGLTCHHIGTVQSFDPVRQLCSATINYKKTFYEPDPAAPGNYIPVLVDYPVLLDCPTIVFGGGGGCLTFPISQGDECLVLFNDRDLDNWLQGGGAGAVSTPRLHSFSDGIILVGLNSLANVVTKYSSSQIQMRFKSAGALIGVAKNGVNVLSPTALSLSGSPVSLGQQLLQLLCGLNAFVATCMTSTTDPTLVTAATALGLILNNGATAIFGTPTSYTPGYAIAMLAETLL